MGENQASVAAETDQYMSLVEVAMCLNKLVRSIEGWDDLGSMIFDVSRTRPAWPGMLKCGGETRALVSLPLMASNICRVLFKNGRRDGEVLDVPLQRDTLFEKVLKPVMEEILIERLLSAARQLEQARALHLPL